MQTCWILSWETRALKTGLRGFFDANMFHPERRALAHSTHLIGLLPLAAPVVFITGNPILAYNTCFLANIVFSGLAVYGLVRALTGDSLAAVAAGALFAFAPFRFAQSSHMSRTFTVWMPFTFLFLHRFLRTGRVFEWFLFTVTCNLQALTRYYHAYPLVLGVFWAIIVWHIAQRSWPTRSVAVGLLLFVLVSAAIHLPIARVYYQVQQSYGVERPPNEIRALSVQFTDFLSAASRNKLFGTLTERWRSSYPTERSLFPGITTVLLAVFGVWSGMQAPGASSASGKSHGCLRRRAGVLVYGGVLTLALLLSLGPEVEMFGLVLRLPYFWLSQHIPGMSGLRAPAKFITPAFMALAVLSGYGMAYIRELIRTRTRRNQDNCVSFVVLAIVIVAASLEGWSDQEPETIPVGDERPAVYKWIEQHDRTQVLIELPMRGLHDITDVLRETQRLFYSTYHWKRLVNGYASVVPPSYRETARYMNGFPDDESIQRLRSIGVDTIALHGDQFTSEGMESIWDRLPAFYEDVDFVQCWQQDCVMYLEDNVISDPPRRLGTLLDGRISLVGFEIEPSTVGSGEILHVRLWWQAHESIDESFTVFTHLVSSSGEIVGQHDGWPQGGRHPTDQWEVGEIVVDDHYLSVGSHSQSGPHEVQVGMYLLSTMERLPIPSDGTGENRIVLDAVDVH